MEFPKPSGCIPFLTLLFVAILLAFGAASCAPDKPKPVEFAPSEDACSHCKMAISDRKFAAEIVRTDGSADFFDDIGCLAAWIKTNPPDKTAAIYVVDFATGQWTDAETASYVKSQAIFTPMSSGVIAFFSLEAARKSQYASAGMIMTFAELKAEAR